jgi:hypothetical protein
MSWIEMETASDFFKGRRWDPVVRGLSAPDNRAVPSGVLSDDRVELSVTWGL